MVEASTEFLMRNQDIYKLFINCSVCYVTAPDLQRKYNVILKRVHVTVSVFEKQYILHIVTVCV